VQGKYLKMLVNLLLLQIYDIICKLRQWLLAFNFDHINFQNFVLFDNSS
jgi:hypothetical protein